MLRLLLLIGLCTAWSTISAAEPLGEQHVYKQVEGRDLKLWVVKPPEWNGDLPRPAIVFYHGGGWVGGTPRQFELQGKYLASRGLVVIHVEYRLLDREANDPPTVCVQDAKSAMRWVRSHADELGIDPLRIGAGGGSAGGHLAAFVGMVEGNDAPTDDIAVSAKANALLLFNPVFDNGPEDGWGTKRIGDRYPEFSPAHNVSADDPPAIVFLGTQDKLIPVSVVERIDSAMEQAGVRCDAHYYDGQPHGFFNKDPHQTETLVETDRFLNSLGWLEGEPTLAPVTAAPRPERPNFIIFNVDDLGYADIGPFGSQTNATPNLDRMAQEGRKLTCHYGAPVCSPSRASLMTGCYPKRVLPIQHVLFPASAVGLHPDEVTIAETLKERGYITACIGKWHLGDQPPFLPTQQGFDSYYGLPYSNDMGTGLDGSKSNFGDPLPEVFVAPREQPPEETGVRGKQPPLPLLENTTVLGAVDPAGQQRLTQDYTTRALDFIRQHQGEPFLLYMPHSAVHFPLYPREEFRGKSKNGLFGDWVQEMDWSVGQVLDTLRELKLDQKTLVLFTSDNGGSVRHGSNNAPLRGTKGQTFEGGLRVPTIAWWPGQIPAGTQSDAITSMMDVLPTLTALAGGKLPEDRKLDGVNIWNVMSNPVVEHPPRIAFHYYRGLNLEAVRSGPWKLHLAKSELYHLGNDIGESMNVAGDHPEVVKALWEMAINADHDLGRSGVGPGCRVLGRVDKAVPLIDDASPASAP